MLTKIWAVYQIYLKKKYEIRMNLSYIEQIDILLVKN